MDNNQSIEVFGYRNFPHGSRLGYFKLKIYISENDWIDVDSWKLMKNTNPTMPDEYYVLPPSEKDKDGKFRNFASYSQGLKELITQKAIVLYKSNTPVTS